MWLYNLINYWEKSPKTFLPQSEYTRYDHSFLPGERVRGSFVRFDRMRSLKVYACRTTYCQTMWWRIRSLPRWRTASWPCLLPVPYLLLFKNWKTGDAGHKETANCLKVSGLHFEWWWSWRESNPRPNRETIRFLHAYSSLRFSSVSKTWTTNWHLSS